MSLYDEIMHLPEEYSRVLLTYKTQQCQLNCLDQTICPLYHSNDEMRRPLFDSSHLLQYYCGNIPCTCGRFQCSLAHNSYEINYHPSKFKTITCLNYKNCAFKNFYCPFLHENEKSLKDFLNKAISPTLQNQVPKKKNSLKYFSNSFIPNGKFQIILQIDKMQRDLAYPDKMIYFKVNQCELLEENHNWNQCQFYHNDKDRRRVIGNYSAERCLNKNCLKGDECEFSHNDPEQLYHPDKYKKRFCSLYPNELEKCKFGNFCSFAHAENEIRLVLLERFIHDDEFNLFYYKTIWCPKNNQHDKAQCVYAHNVQDFRRTPLEYFYDADDCNFWCKIDNKNKYEKGGCSKMMECNKCHGWKENEYHPFNYKKWKCTLGDSCKKKECAYLHAYDDKNKITMLIDYYTKKKNKNTNTMNKNLAKDLKNGKNFKQKGESNFKQPIIISQQIISNLNYNNNNIPMKSEKIKKNLNNKEPYMSQKGSRCQSVTSNDENSFESIENQFKGNKKIQPQPFICFSDSHDEKKIQTEKTDKTTKATLSVDSSIFIPSFNRDPITFNNNNERNSEKEDKNLPKEKMNRFQSCPSTPDYKYALFEQNKKTFTTEFRKKFENLNILQVLDKFLSNLYFEDVIKKMRVKDLEKLEFLNEEERIKVIEILKDFNPQF